jgi:hypothetical protein
LLDIKNDSPDFDNGLARKSGVEAEKRSFSNKHAESQLKNNPKGHHLGYASALISSNSSFIWMKRSTWKCRIEGGKVNVGWIREA